jgi:hypothetical protein
MKKNIINKRESTISSMCLTFRHDYGLLKHEEQRTIWNQMAQIFDNDIAPVMDFKKNFRGK